MLPGMVVLTRHDEGLQMRESGAFNGAELEDFGPSAELQGSPCLQLAICTTGLHHQAASDDSPIHDTNTLGSLVKCTLKSVEDLCCTCSQSACLGEASRSGPAV